MVRIFFVALTIFVFGLFPQGDAHAQASLDLRGNVGGSGIPGGSIIPGYDSATCDSSIEGAIRYNSGSSCAEFCNGSSWTCPRSGGGCTVIWDALNDETNIAQSTVISSDIEYVSTSGCTSADVSISGGGSPEYRICADSTCSSVPHTWGSANGSIDNGEYIQSRLTSGSSPGSMLTARLTLAETATDWSVTTANVPAYVARTQTTADNTNITLNKPVGTIEDDLMIATIMRRDYNDNISPPAGWTLIDQANVGSFGDRMGIWYKIASASEPASYNFNWTATQDVTGSIVTIRNVDTANPIDIESGGSGSSDTPTAPSITTTVDNTLMVAIAGYSDNRTFTPPVNYTERVDVQVSIYVSQTVATYLQASSGASGTAIFTASGGNEDWRTRHIAVKAP